MNKFIFLILFIITQNNTVYASNPHDMPLTEERIDNFLQFVRQMRQSPHTEPIPDAAKNTKFESLFEVALHQWKETFLLEKKPRTTKLEKMKAKNAARVNVNLFVYGVNEAFENVVNRKKRSFSVNGILSMACPSDIARNAIRENELHFATYTSLIRWVLGEELYVNMRKTVYGEDHDLGIGWLNDHHSILPFVIDKRLPIFYHSLCFGECLNDMQRAVLIQNGKVHLSSGIFMQAEKSVEARQSIKLIAHHGYPLFTSERITARLPINSPFLEWYTQSLIADGKNEEDVNLTLHRGVFFDFPETKEEETLFQAVLLETMMELDLITAPMTSHLMAEQEQEDLPEESPLLPTVISPTDSLYLTVLREEWERRQAAVVQGAIEGRKKDPQPKKDKKAKHSADQAVTAQQVKPVFQPTPADLEHIRQRGRLKYRHLARLVAEALRAKREGLWVEMKKSGSHFNLHISTTSSGSNEQGGGVTLIRMHGKQDRTVPATVAVNLVSQIQQLLCTNESDMALPASRRRQ